jgi:hypothetical protein
VYAGDVLNQPVNAWLEGKQSRTFNLNTRQVRFYPVTDYNLQTTNPSQIAKPFEPGRAETKTSIPLNRSAPAGRKPPAPTKPK